MKNKTIFLITFLSFLCNIPLSLYAEIARQDIVKDWKFRQARKVTWHDAEVPGTVHTDLLRNNMIPDPFIGENEREVQWVDKEDWIYETTFDIDSLISSNDNADIVFAGLDTYADVYLNDSLIFNADNMFREWRKPVKELLKSKDNKLMVYFHSPIKIDMPKFEALPFQYDAVNDQSENGGIFDKKVSVFARKAGYHYGWDWGPRLVTSGIWRPVYLAAWSGPKINDIYISTDKLNDKKAFLNAKVEIESDKYHDGEIEITDLTNNKILLAKKISLNKGQNILTLPFSIKNPKLWWSNGLGSPNLYDIQISFKDDKNQKISKTLKTGIRKIEVVREEDEKGRSFFFKLNGVPLFIKGANYIPNDNFLPRVTEETYRKTIQDAVDANMNMLRVWGGGIYENDIFYELCDSLGIMVWQDFMFACSLYPSEGEMRENIEIEARENIRRLRNHPSIALWCGNNECLEAWYNWGLKERYTEQGYADVIWKQYDDLFHKLLPEVVSDEAPEAFYWPSSPFSSVDVASENNKGDTHLWSVWGGSEPISTYNDITSRFFSEYGFQSFPEYSTVMKYAPDTAQHYIDSDVMLAHQRAGADANRRIERYLLQHYPVPKDFKSFLYLSHVLQGDAVKTAIEAHRRNKPYTMGTMFWQHNDCWPVASWSSRDYYGNWKAAHYIAREAYKDILISAIGKGDSVDIHIISDRIMPVDGTLSCDIYSLKGDRLISKNYSADIPSSSSQIISLPKEELLGDRDPADVVAYFKFSDTNGENYEYVYTFVEPKDLNLQKPEIYIDIENINGEKVMTVSSDNYVKSLTFSLPEECFFSKNYFDIIPGEEYKVIVTTNLNLDTIKNNLEVISVYDAAEAHYKDKG